MAEQLAFQQLFGNRRAIHRHKGRVLAITVEMNGFGDEFFAGPAFPGDQHIGRTVGDPLNQVEHRLHRFALAENLVEAILLGHLFPEPADFPSQRCLADDPFDHPNQFVFFHRLCEVVARPMLHRFHSRLDRSKRRHQDHVDIRM